MYGSFFLIIIIMITIIINLLKHLGLFINVILLHIVTLSVAPCGSGASK